MCYQISEHFLLFAHIYRAVALVKIFDQLPLLVGEGDPVSTVLG
jgi:hypothetical protein